jgi:hypothetical protein
MRLDRSHRSKRMICADRNRALAASPLGSSSHRRSYSFAKVLYRTYRDIRATLLLIPRETAEPVIPITLFYAKLPSAYALWGAAAIGASPGSTNPAVSVLILHHDRKRERALRVVCVCIAFVCVTKSPFLFPPLRPHLFVAGISRKPLIAHVALRERSPAGTESINISLWTCLPVEHSRTRTGASKYNAYH